VFFSQDLPQASAVVTPIPLLCLDMHQSARSLARVITLTPKPPPVHTHTTGRRPVRDMVEMNMEISGQDYPLYHGGEEQGKAGVDQAICAVV